MVINNPQMLKVKDLIAALEKLDPNLEIYGYSDDPELVSEKEGYKVFSVDSVDVHQVEKSRHELTDMPQIKFSTEEGTRKVAFVNLSYRF